MRLSPRYDGSVILTIEGSYDDQLAPVIRQRRRLESVLVSLDSDGWTVPSRCSGWTVKDVASHLVGVNAFWHGSVTAGTAGTPTRLLAGFDPAATPPLMVDAMRSLPPAAVLEQLVSSNDLFLGTLSDLDAGGWAATAESPAGHVPVRLLAFHALWDCWVHERDIALPLGIAPAEEGDEVSACLRYAAALSPILAMAFGEEPTGVLAVEASDPTVSFALEIGESVTVSNGSSPVGVACLRGGAVQLVEALSMRSALSPSAPAEWQQLITGLARAFDLSGLDGKPNEGDL